MFDDLKVRKVKNFQRNYFEMKNFQNLKVESPLLGFENFHFHFTFRFRSEKTKVRRKYLEKVKIILKVKKISLAKFSR